MLSSMLSNYALKYAIKHAIKDEAEEAQSQSRPALRVCAVGEAAAGSRDSSPEGVYLCTQSCGQQQAPPGRLCANSGSPG